jgi:outer membrane protein TolC
MQGMAVAIRHYGSRRWLGAVVACASLTSSVASADPASSTQLPTDPLLASLIEQSLAARPELAAARADVRAERERVPQASTLPDPMLQLGVQNDGFTSWEVGKMETSYYSVMVSQTFPWPGKLGLRSDVAELAADQAEQSVTRARLSTEADVRRAYLGLVLARDRTALLDRLEAIWQRSAAVAGSKNATGQGAQSDVLRAQLELNRLRQRRWALEVERASEEQTLNRLRGRPLDEPIEPTVRLTDLALPVLRDPSALARDALERSPELAAARIGVTQYETSVSLAHKGALPDLTVSLGVMPRGGDFPPMWLATVGIPIPIFGVSKQDRAVAEGRARVLAGQKNAEGLEQVLRLRARQRHTALSITLETIRLYRDGLLVQSEATAESTITQYEVGRVTFASVLEANAGLIADQDGYLQALAQAHRLEIERAEISLGSIVPGSASMGADRSAMPGAGTTGRAAAGSSTATTSAPNAGGSSAMTSM